MLSILGEHDPYEFHSGFELDVRLKDILESNVDEKYYLSEEVQARFKPNDKFKDMSANIVGTTAPDFRTIGQRDLCYQENSVMGTLVATDYKQPKQTIELTQAGALEGKHEQSSRVYSEEGIIPTLMAGSRKSCTGGYISPKIVVERIICEQRVDEGLRFFKDDICGCLRTIDACGDKRIIELEPLICASRGRNVENPSDRTPGIHTEQRLEINYSGASNTITTVQKDNYVLETNFRIRKLTPKECWRLMGINDECFDKAQQVNSNSQLYKQAGNGIVVDVLYYIFKELFKDNIVE